MFPVTDDGMAHLSEAQLVRALAALEVAREAIDTLTSELIKRDAHNWVGRDANEALKAFHFVDDRVWLGEGGTINFPEGYDPEEPVPCLEPLSKDAADRYSGTVCGEEAVYVVWGGRGMRDGAAIAYPACEKHARKMGIWAADRRRRKTDRVRVGA